jgi:hypothetical protein
MILKFPYINFQKHRTTWMGIHVLAAMAIAALCPGQQLRDDQLARQAAPAQFKPAKSLNTKALTTVGAPAAK